MLPGDPAGYFLHGLIDQVDITDRREFDMLPKVGNQLIRFGTGTDAEKLKS